MTFIRNNTFSFLLISMLLLSSCSKVLYSHNDVMARYRSKADVIKGFGLPTVKKEEGQYSEWIYNYGSTIQGFNTKLSGSNVNLSKYNTYSTYVKFNFQGDKVIDWRTQGTDFTVKSGNDEKTLLWILGISGVLIFIGGILTI